MKKFTLGVVAGMTSLAIAVPLVVQISSAATAGSSSSTKTMTRTPPTVSDLIARDNAFLSNVDALITVEKSATQAHLTALMAAQSITDPTQQKAAIQKANQDERTTIQNAITANANLKSAMMPIGFGFGEKMGGGMPMRGHGPMNDTALAAKLGITAAQLQTELQSGKTLQQIATEHGVTLPTPMKGGWKHAGTTSSTSSAH